MRFWTLTEKHRCVSRWAGYLCDGGGRAQHHVNKPKRKYFNYVPETNQALRRLVKGCIYSMSHGCNFLL